MARSAGGDGRRASSVSRSPRSPDAGDLATDATTRITLLDGVDALPPQMRAALILRYYAELSVDEVATALGKSPNTVKAQLQAALDRLRIHLADPVGGAFREVHHA
jgi:RNA polymerase sigma factor (sigma-70 family)